MGAGPDVTGSRGGGRGVWGAPRECEEAAGEADSARLHCFVGDNVWAKPVSATDIRNERDDTTLDSTDTKRKTGNGLDNFMSISSTT